MSTAAASYALVVLPARFACRRLICRAKYACPHIRGERHEKHIDGITTSRQLISCKTNSLITTNMTATTGTLIVTMTAARRSAWNHSSIVRGARRITDDVLRRLTRRAKPTPERLASFYPTADNLRLNFKLTHYPFVRKIDGPAEPVMIAVLRLGRPPIFGVPPSLKSTASPLFFALSWRSLKLAQ